MNGPIVIEIPPANGGSLNGNIVTVVADAARGRRAARRRQGRGRQVRDPAAGLRGTVPEGFTPLQSDTFGGYALLRSNLASHSEADVAKSIDYGKQVKVYPLAQADNPPETVFTDVQDVLFDSTIRYDATLLRAPRPRRAERAWLDRDRAMIDHAQNARHREGQAVQARTPRRAAMLDAAVVEAKAFIVEAQYERGWAAVLRGDAAGAPAACRCSRERPSRATPSRRVSDRPSRRDLHASAIIGIKRLGTGQFYLTGAHGQGRRRRSTAARTYRLDVPPNAPVEQYWSVTAYDRETHALVRNMDRASRASNAAEVQKNADGSVDIYFGPEAPAGKESNWVPTDPQRGLRADVPRSMGRRRNSSTRSGCCLTWRRSRRNERDRRSEMTCTRRALRQMGSRPLPVRRVPDLRHRRALLRRRALADRRAVHAEHHALVGLSLDALGRRRAGRRARHGGDGADAA